MSDIRILSLSGADIQPYLSALANLRITVFREFPYLYNGNAAYEQKYLDRYVRSEKSVIVLALDGAAVIGASTGKPMAEEDPSVRKPFEQADADLSEIFYFGESILLPSYRGRGLGVAFFREREAHALHHGFRITTFCAVDRPADHPRRPPDYIPLHNFWKKRGYIEQPDMKATFTWQDLDESSESPKTLTFWVKNHK